MTILDMSRAAIPLILAIVLLRAACINRLPKRTFVALWSIALVRLLVPYSLPSRLNAQSLGRLLIGALTPTAVEPAAASIIYVPKLAYVPNIEPLAVAEAAAVPPPLVAAALPLSGLPWYLWVWLVGMLATCAFFLVTYIQGRRQFRDALPVQTLFIERWRWQHPLRRNLSIRQSDRIRGPLTRGILRPVILLPKSALNLPDAQLSAILLHEYTHIRRFDAVTKAILAMALCIHWFNPLVWVLFALYGRDIELSCDEAVLRQLGAGGRSSYALTLLDMEERRGHPSPLHASFSKYAIEERIQAIMKTKRMTLLETTLALILVLGLTVIFATSTFAEDVTAPADEAGQATSMATDPAAGDAVDWMSYDEYKAWLSDTRKELDALAKEGAVGWTPEDGAFPWTKEKVDALLAEYEAVLKDIEDTIRIARPGSDAGNVSVAMVPEMRVTNAATIAQPAQDISAGSAGVSFTVTEAIEATPAQTRDLSFTIADEAGATPVEGSSISISVAKAADVAAGSAIPALPVEPAGTIAIAAVESDGTGAVHGRRHATVESAPGVKAAVATIAEDGPQAIRIQRADDTAYASTSGETVTIIQERGVAGHAVPAETVTYSIAKEGMAGVPSVSIAQAAEVEAISESFFASFTVGENITVNMGPFESAAALDKAMRDYLDAQVAAGLMTRAEADRAITGH